MCVFARSPACQTNPQAPQYENDWIKTPKSKRDRWEVSKMAVITNQCRRGKSGEVGGGTHSGLRTENATQSHWDDDQTIAARAVTSAHHRTVSDKYSTRWRGDYAPSADASASCATAGSLSLMSADSVGEGGVIKRQQKAPRHPKTKNKNLLLSELTNKLQACLRPSGRIRDAVESAEVSQTRLNTLMHNRSRV